MNTFSKVVVGVVAGAALFAVAPGANAATTNPTANWPTSPFPA